MTDHKSIGARLSNAVWDALEAGEVTEFSDLLDREGLLYAAYASTYHWSQVGTVANRARGEHLISRVAARIGLAERAMHHALRCLNLVEADPDAMEDWDLAFALEALSRAQAALGQVAAARSTFARALEAMAAIEDEEDRAVIEAELRREPWFGLQRE